MIDNRSSKRNINLVIGLGKSGFWAAKYLRSINKRVIVWENKDGLEFLERKTALEELNIIVSLNKEFVFEEIQPFVKEIESVVVSPSIPYDHITIIKLKKKLSSGKKNFLGWVDQIPHKHFYAKNGDLININSKREFLNMNNGI